MFRTRKNLFQLLPRSWFITMAEDLSQGILRATIPCFGLWQIVPNVLLFPWHTVLLRRILTPLQMMMHGPLSHGSLITLPKSVSTRIDSRQEVIVQVVSWLRG